jgi:hypothetical protein
MAEDTTPKQALVRAGLVLHSANETLATAINKIERQEVVKPTITALRRARETVRVAIVKIEHAADALE